MSTQTEHEADFDVDDPRLSRFELVREGARRDGVEIVHYAQRFPVPGTRAERRIERTIGLCFMLCALGAIAFVVAFIWWPWEHKLRKIPYAIYARTLLALATVAAARIHREASCDR